MKITQAINKTQDIEIGDKVYKQHKLSIGETVGLGKLIDEEKDFTRDEIIDGLIKKDINGFWIVAKATTDIPDEVLVTLDDESITELFMFAFGINKKKVEEQITE
jgi:hypothetical protein